MKRINHFATAFFGVCLQSKSEYRDSFSEDFGSQFDDLAWGVYAESDLCTMSHPRPLPLP